MPVEPDNELAASLAQTLHRAARRNERVTALVRVGLVGIISALELYWAVTAGGVATLSARSITWLMFVCSVGVYLTLRRGTYSPWMPFALPLMDAAFIGFRMQRVVEERTHASLLEHQELATVLGIATVLVLTGAFRMRWQTVLFTAVLGGSLYLWFAVQLSLELTQIITHLAVLAALAALSFALMREVRRAVQSELGRLTLSRFLPKSVIEEAHADPMALITQPRAVEATILITDIRGFTRWAENREPMEVLAFLNVVQGTLAGIVRRNHGTVDKFLGDGMLAVFGAPESLPDHAARACEAAREMQVQLAALNLRSEGAQIAVGIAVHSGEIVVGCLGSGVRMEFTVLGDTVNTTSRLEELTKEHSVDVLISDAAVRRLSRGHGLTEVGDLPVRGREASLKVWTLADDG